MKLKFKNNKKLEKNQKILNNNNLTESINKVQRLIFYENKPQNQKIKFKIQKKKWTIQNKTNSLMKMTLNNLKNELSCWIEIYDKTRQ